MEVFCDQTAPSTVLVWPSVQAAYSHSSRWGGTFKPSVSVIPDMRLRQEDGECIVRPCLRKVQVFRKRLLTARRLAASFRSLTVSLFELNKKCYAL